MTFAHHKSASNFLLKCTNLSGERQKITLEAWGTWGDNKATTLAYGVQLVGERVTLVRLCLALTFST